MCAKRSDNRNTGCQQLTAQAANTGGVVASRGNGETEAAGELLPEVCWRLAGAETQHDVQENPTRLCFWKIRISVQLRGRKSQSRQVEGGNLEGRPEAWVRDSERRGEGGELPLMSARRGTASCLGGCCFHLVRVARRGIPHVDSIRETGR